MYDITHATPELFAALALAQGEIENASKNQVNGAFSKGPNAWPSYADLAEVLNTIRPVFAKHGLSMIQSPGFDGSIASVTTVLAHQSGGYMTSTASCVPAKADAQGIGSATTYLRRYSAAAVAGIAQEDDDGNAAAHNGKPAPVARITPAAGVWESLDVEQQEFLQKIAAAVMDIMPDAGAAMAYIAEQNLDADEKTALWTRFDSSTRTALKKAHKEAA
jgi:hypothetical protein